LIEASEFANLILPTRQELATAITDSLTHDLATLQGHQRIVSLTYQVIVAGVDLSSYTPEVRLST
jgi:hypothetical protein